MEIEHPLRYHVELDKNTIQKIQNSTSFTVQQNGDCIVFTIGSEIMSFKISSIDSNKQIYQKDDSDYPTKYEQIDNVKFLKKQPIMSNPHRQQTPMRQPNQFSQKSQSSQHSQMYNSSQSNQIKQTPQVKQIQSKQLNQFKQNTQNSQTQNYSQTQSQSQTQPASKYPLKSTEISHIKEDESQPSQTMSQASQSQTQQIIDHQPHSQRLALVIPTEPKKQNSQNERRIQEIQKELEIVVKQLENIQTKFKAKLQITQIEDAKRSILKLDQEYKQEFDKLKEKYRRLHEEWNLLSNDN